MKKILLLTSFFVFGFNAIHADTEWTLEDGTQTIEGTGDMTDYHYNAKATQSVNNTNPWNESPAEETTEKPFLTDDFIYDRTEQNDDFGGYSRDFKNTNWQAIYLPFSIAYEDWKDEFDVAYINGIRQYDRDDDGKVDEAWMDAIQIKKGMTMPNHPYIIRAKSTGEKKLKASSAAEPSYEKSISCSTTTTEYIFTGVYRNVPAKEMVDNNYYALGGGELIRSNGESGLKPYRWYMNENFHGVPIIDGKETKAKSIKLNVIDEEEATTGVKEFRQTENKDNSVYDMNGRKMNESNLKPGLYIKNGKKFIIK